MRIISVGKPHSAGYRPLIDDYEKRLDRSRNVEWLFMPPSGREKEVARRAESDAVRLKLKSEDIMVLLDERGIELTSEVLASRLEDWLGRSRPITLVIGGAYGVDDELRQRADFVWSLSPLVFPHELVRLALLEQLYRAQCISAGHPYHHT